MPPASEEMKEWSAMLGEELKKWPKVAAKPMFGMRAYFRGSKIFGALPVSRGIASPNGFMFKISPMPPELQERAAMDPHIAVTNNPRTHKWRIFELTSSADLRDALWWLNQAYEKAK